MHSPSPHIHIANTHPFTIHHRHSHSLNKLKTNVPNSNRLPLDFQKHVSITLPCAPYVNVGEIEHIGAQQVAYVTRDALRKAGLTLIAHVAQNESGASGGNWYSANAGRKRGWKEGVGC